LNNLKDLKISRVRVLLTILISLASGLFVFHVIELAAHVRQRTSPLSLSGDGVLVLSGLFLLLILLASWIAWFQLRARERDQHRLRRSEHRYRTIINHAGEAIFLLDGEGLIHEWNKQAERLFGVARRAVLGKPFRDIHLCYGLEVDRVLADVARRGTSLSFDFPFPRSGASGGQLSLTLSPITATGEPGPPDPDVPVNDPERMFVAIARDVTSERQLETRMSETEKLAGIGQLAAGIAHQLNTPLGSILLSAQLLADVELDADAREDVDRIIRQTEQCRTTIKGLLNFARSRPADRGLVPLGETARETIYLMDKNLKLAGVEVVIEDSGPATVHGNRNELDQVFFNLLANAVDAMPDGGRIRIAITDGGPGEILVEFSDTGEGIPPENREQVFLPFFTTKEYGRGTGLGLSIVARIVHEHGGRIELESEVGRGTRFLLTFPRPGYGIGGDRTAPAVAESSRAGRADDDGSPAQAI